MSTVPPLAPSGCRRIYYVYIEDVVGDGVAGKLDVARWDALCTKARTLGFDSILTPPLWSGANCLDKEADKAAVRWRDSSAMEDVLGGMASVCAQHGLDLMTDLVLDKTVGEEPARVRGDDGLAPIEFIEAWSRRLGGWVRAGVSGFRCRAPAELSRGEWRRLIDNVRSLQPHCHFMAWTPGLGAGQIDRLKGAGFDATFSSLPWWDYRATWLIDEYVRLGAIAPVFSPVTDPDTVVDPADFDLAQAGNDARRKIWTAAIAGNGVLVTTSLEKIAGSLTLAQLNKWLQDRPNTTGRLRVLSGALSPATVLFRSGAGLLINPDGQVDATKKWADVRARLPHDNGMIQVMPDPDGAAGVPCSDAAELKPGGCLLFLTFSDQCVTATATTAEDKRKAVVAALRAARITIDGVIPEVDKGRFPAKTQIGETVVVQADIFMDGHERILASMLWRAADEVSWRETFMTMLENDRWEARFSPTRIGKHYFTIRAWHDRWGSYREQLAKKVAAGQDVSLDVEEGRALLLNAVQPRKTSDRPMDDSSQYVQSLTRILDDVGMPRQTPRLKTRRAAAARSECALVAGLPVPPARPEQVEILLSETVAAAMRETDIRRFEATCERPFEIGVERREASFASWYELFPRSCGSKPGVHGTFRDVMKRLPAIRDMGFDVLYFPPIHPIGLSNRKGRNNSLKASPEDPGSPYAIGSVLGGHTSVHPQLGTLQDFQALVECARQFELEVALDFAIQCSPDHPWLAQHPEWFSWRADGSLRYAENPPKRYEDIVSPSFYSSLASASRQMALWRELRDVVLFWIEHGIHIFRVDNPHTKPLPFWQWLISDVQGTHPDTIFLSEAFTRPKMMYRLAKIGFSQSYTYFTWRNTKQELIDYLTELNSPSIASFFRPHFFVNTPDINPYFLQTSGRAGFLIRAALAATTSGLWGMYNGFELCEARALPGKEEYLDSEKYELRSWDWNRPGNIVPEITKLNQIRRTNPALQSHLGIRFHHVDDDRILFFSKSTPQRDSIVLVAISLDPYAVRFGTLELPLWQWSLPDNATVLLEDLFDDRRFALSGKHHRVELTPQRPFLLWKVLPPI